MAAFIVISADNRLHYLVDGIEKCRPLNSDVSTAISTGKISKTENGYIYNYTIHGEENSGDTAKPFSELLSNQLAAFRLAYTVPHDELVNIFYLENPLTENDLNESEFWLEDFEKVYDAGFDTNFCLFRILFTYNPDIPTDVNSQIDINALQRLLDNHKNAIIFSPQSSGESRFERYLFYIDNQKCDAAALCLRKDEHDLKMPRILIDFMMLVSNSFDKYNVIAAINPPLVTTRCFSVGYAESMYYYPDVERYYIHADNRDIYHKFLTAEDEKLDGEGVKSMDIEKYPFGLRSRQKRLAVVCEDVPFSENISNHPTSADYKIDRCIVELRDLLVQQREMEIEDFNNSSEIVNRRNEIMNLEEQVNAVKWDDGETQEEHDARVQKLCTIKDKATEELNQLIHGFEPDCPEYISRSDIYDELCVADEEERETIMNSRSDQYRKLVSFAKSKKFYAFKASVVKKEAESASVSNENNDISNKSDNFFDNLGCLPSWLMFWRTKRVNSKPAKVDKSEIVPCDVFVRKNITSISEQLALKSRFIDFTDEVSAVEKVYDDEKKYCEEFKLTTHTNHYFPLINISELAKKHDETSETRILKSINTWRLDEEPLRKKLINIVKKTAKDHTRKYYQFIDWDNPFPFVPEISSGLPIICNELQKRSAPMVNYNLTSDTKEDKIIRYLFSDRPHFKEEIDGIRAKLNNGNEIIAAQSTHMASKICMFQFLPMDEKVLENLVDLRVSETLY